VIGILALESKETAAFSGYDENLLVIIASHLAGLVEYGRLREEAEARARNLGLIHDVIQQVIGSTNIDDVAQITANLLVQHFSYELATLLLVDRHQKLNMAGSSGEAAPLVKSAFEKLEYPSENGVSGHVLATGESIMVDDASKDLQFKHTSEWHVGSKICVALREGDRILGIIDVESSVKNAFTHNDLLALESLAGFLTSAVSNVDRYQMLQDTIQILQTTQEELQERMEAQHAAENKLIQAAKLAAVGEMAAGVAHELNNPLTTVAGFSELVLEELPPASTQRADLEMVLREAKRARSVVRRLLDFARQSESVRVRADFNEVIEDVATLTRHLLETSDVDFKLQLDENIPWVLMDRDQMKQVVLNLMHNALHAMPKGGELFVRTETRQKDNEEWVVMIVQDTGKGITPDDLGRIFEPFFTTKADDGGTGLGLAVSYGIVTDHDGFVDVESTPNEGACFTVWLPIEEKH
jgi:signal transduction histidine kinase